MDRAVPRHAREAGQAGRPDHDGKMRFTRSVISRVTGMAVTFVDDLQPFRRKGRLKPFTNSVFHRHFAVNPLQSRSL